ncbi:hypothetical protein [Larkinella soli]|uniref:hypothetical protein n=1 Tax=Larkinella soli TaxID=1770527 RepID=UPI000FFCC00C|nr:hypothetical protein [Larkinella soli]
MERLQELASNYPLDFVADFFDVFILTIGLYKFKNLSWEMRFFVGYFFCTFIKDLISLYFAYYKWTNFYIYNIYSFFEIFFITAAYIAVFKKPYQKKITAYIGGISVILNAFFFSFEELSALNFTIFRIFTIIMVLMHFVTLLSEMTVKNIAYYSMFWISSGLLLYATGTLFTFLFIKYLYTVSRETRNFFLDSTQVLYILFCLFSAVGFYFSRYDRENFI